jgi:hypothetical protein
MMTQDIKCTETKKQRPGQIPVKNKSILKASPSENSEIEYMDGKVY